jgi:hypothetical protein
VGPSYVEVRHNWLTRHSNPDVRPSAYRTRDLLREIKRGNWDFRYMPTLANGTPVDGQGAVAPPKSNAPSKPPLDAAVPFLGDFEEQDVEAAGAGQEALPPQSADASPAQPSDARTQVLRQLAQAAGVGAAATRLIAYRDKYRPTSNPRYWAVVDFDVHSAKPRLFLFDCVAGVTTAHLCAHGRGSEGPADDGIAEVLSNEDGSNCSSLGIYHCDVTYIGGHGRSLYLDGLESTNSNARRRHIVMHGADFVAPEVIKNTGRIGRSLGCPAIEMADVQKLIPALQGGSLMILRKTGR